MDSFQKFLELKQQTNNNLETLFISIKNCVQECQTKLTSQKKDFLTVQQLSKLPVHNPQQFIELIRSKFSELTSENNSNIQQTLSILGLTNIQLQNINKYIKQMQSSLNQQRKNVAVLKQQINTLSSQKTEKEALISNLLEDKVQLKKKVQELCYNFDIQMKDLCATHKTQLEAKQLDIQAVKQMQQFNSTLKKQLSFQEEEKTKLSDHLEALQNRIQFLQGEVEKSKGLLEWEVKKKLELEEKIVKDQQIIARYDDELQSLNNALRHPYEQVQGKINQLQYYFIPPRDNQEIIDTTDNEAIIQSSNEESPTRKRNQTLMEETQGIKLDWKNHSKNNLDFQNELKKIDSVNQLSQQPQTIKALSAQTYALANIQKKLNRLPQLDPYYCHYILLSQAIKIRQNEEKLFNTDIKPYYKQIIEKKIPMHEWQAWILDKMQELADIPKKESPQIQKNNETKSTLQKLPLIIEALQIQKRNQKVK